MKGLMRNNGRTERSEDFLEKEGVVANHGWFES